MNKYQNGKIYKIESDTIKGVYIGSTTIPTLSLRLSGHKSAYKRWVNDNTCMYTSSYLLMGNNDYHITLLENFPCDTKDELQAREKYYIDNTENCINTLKYDYDPIQYWKNYRIMHREQIKQYREDHKEKTKQYNIKYHEINKDEKKATLSHNIMCECGGQYSLWNKSNHEKTFKHIKHFNKDAKEAQMKCECGFTCNVLSIKKHKRSAAHNTYMELLNKEIVYEPYKLEIKEFNIDIDIN